MDSVGDRKVPEPATARGNESGDKAENPARGRTQGRVKHIEGYRRLLDNFREQRNDLRQALVLGLAGMDQTDDPVSVLQPLLAALTDYVARGHFRLYPDCLGAGPGPHPDQSRLQTYSLIARNTEQLLSLGDWLGSLAAEVPVIRLQQALRRLRNLTSVRFALEEQLLAPQRGAYALATADAGPVLSQQARQSLQPLQSRQESPARPAIKDSAHHHACLPQCP